jgi:hypothetical protein
VKRRAIQIFLGIWLAIQAIGPLHYYFIRKDKHDERFAWRMFSPTRMMSCTPTFLVGGQPEPLDDFHEAWLEIARRGRLVVLEAMGARLCDKYHHQKDVRLDLQCTHVDGTKESWGGSDLCKFPDL